MGQWILFLPLGICIAVFYQLFRDVHHKRFLESIEIYANRRNWEVTEIRMSFREKWFAPVPVYEVFYTNAEGGRGVARFELKFWKLHSTLDVLSEASES